MRTTLDIDDDVLTAAKERARAEGRSAGAVISELARKGLAGPVREAGDPPSFLGIAPLPKRGQVVTNELVDRLREDLGE